MSPISYKRPDRAGCNRVSGGSDLQPTLGTYILNVDSILNSRPGEESQRTPATGRCEMHGSDDGRYVTSLSCAADTEFGPMALTLEGDGKPVTVRQYPELISGGCHRVPDHWRADFANSQFIPGIHNDDSSAVPMRPQGLFAAPDCLCRHGCGTAVQLGQIGAVRSTAGAFSAICTNCRSFGASEAQLF
jgi:hypothetical protein